MGITIEKTNVYAIDLQSEIFKLNSFASSITCLQADKVLSNMNIRVVFDDNNEPKIEDTVQDLEQLIDRLIQKYGPFIPSNHIANGKESDLERFKKYLDYIKRRIEDDNLGGLFDTNLKWNDEKITDDNIKRDLDKVKELILNAHHEYKVKGLYDHSLKIIVFFTKNMDDALEDYISVFAHEYFHAIHFHLIDLIKGSGNYSTDRYYQDVVLESLATYFQIQYLEDRGFSNKANSLKRDISKNSPIFYPYSGCNDFYSSWKKVNFCDILDTSCNDFVKALYDLVEKWEADIIMQINNQHFVVGLGRIVLHDGRVVSVSKGIGGQKIINNGGVGANPNKGIGNSKVQINNGVEIVFNWKKYKLLSPGDLGNTNPYPIVVSVTCPTINLYGYDHAQEILRRFLKCAGVPDSTIRCLRTTHEYIKYVHDEVINGHISSIQIESTNFYGVMQGKEFAIDKTVGIIRAPKIDKVGKMHEFWWRIMDIKPGDIVFNIVAGKIVAFSVATYIGYLNNLTNWFMAPMHYHELTKPIDLRVTGVKTVLARLSPNGSKSCFTSRGTGKQGYLFKLSDELKDYLLSLVLE